MPTLDPKLRDLLAVVIGKENAETGARILAEAGASAAIEGLAVHLPAPYSHLDTNQKQLRNRLRARARQLGDTRHGDGRHETGRLVEQAAYEHWHRMLFARFLAENDLLIHPEMKVAVTLDECAELAASEGAADGWELAGRYASRMLPQIFRPDDPLLAVRFAIDDVKKLEALLDSLPAELFRASDSLGWCYQFWQAKKKKEVNASEVKIGADELPAVTQLFTEPYMVQFLLHNTLGAWWVGAGRTLPLEMPYLRFLDDDTPAAGTFDGWPRLARELKVLDPCCGSGHFLVGAFEILVAFRVAEEGLSPAEACDAVLRDNLFGLEIDARCVQIAAFAVAMAAWTFPGAGGYRPLAPMNVACSGLAISAKKEEWERLGGDNPRLRAGMGRMWELFSDAPVLGSLIDPNLTPENPLYVAGIEEIGPLWDRVLARGADSDDDVEVGIAARGVVTAAHILGAHFSLVVTNVPYLSRGKQSGLLGSYCEKHHPNAKADLATVFVDRAIRFAGKGGSVAAVTPQNWLFLGTYANMRRDYLLERSWASITRLGPRAFETITGEIVNVALVAISAESPGEHNPVLMLDVSECGNAAEKAIQLKLVAVERQPQAAILANPKHVVMLSSAPGTKLGSRLRDYADSLQGLSTGDDGRWKRLFWECGGFRHRWLPLQGPSQGKGLYGGREAVVGRSLVQDSASGGVIRGRAAWGRQGVAIDRVASLSRSIYTGDLFHSLIPVIVPHEARHANAIFAYVLSDAFVADVRRLNQSLSVDNGYLGDVPFNPGDWEPAAATMYPNGLPGPCTTDPTQWLFAGVARRADAPLQVAVSRLLGYRWPDQRPDELDQHTDGDGIVCIPAIRGERPATDRLADLLAAAWGKDWHPQTLTDLLAAVGHAGTVEEWLRDAFFKQHCELFHHRPFIWQIWDGHRDGFSALVNYHKLDHEGLKSLTYSYLGDWIRTQELEAKAGKSGAGDKVAKAKALQQRLAAILDGEAPLDIFVRWKPIEQQPIGWHPDLDDGVRLNIRPFMMVQDVAAKGAGVLRWKPNIKWGKDRGKNPPGSPWGEDRDNDVHLTLEDKQKARGR